VFQWTPATQSSVTIHSAVYSRLPQRSAKVACEQDHLRLGFLEYSGEATRRNLPVRKWGGQHSPRWQASLTGSQKAALRQNL